MRPRPDSPGSNWSHWRSRPLTRTSPRANRRPQQPKRPGGAGRPEEHQRRRRRRWCRRRHRRSTSARPSRSPKRLPTATAAIESAAEADPIALQVDQDLDELATDAPDQSPGDEAAQSPAAPVAAATEREQAPYPQLVHTTAREDEPAEFLLEEAPRKVPVSALVASAQASRAQLSDTLAAIESELFGSTRPPTDTPPGPAEASIPAKPVRAPAAQGPLAALMAMSEEERIALFS